MRKRACAGNRDKKIKRNKTLKKLLFLLPLKLMDAVLASDFHPPTNGPGDEASLSEAKPREQNPQIPKLLADIS